MKRELLFVHGGGAGTHDEWDDKLVESLERELGSSYEVRYPQMPNEDNPRYAVWREALETEIAALSDRAILVGHSVGGAVLVNALAEGLGEVGFGGLFLIAAPFVGDGGWSSDEMASPHDLGARLPTGVPIHARPASRRGLEERRAGEVGVGSWSLKRGRLAALHLLREHHR